MSKFKNRVIIYNLSDNTLSLLKEDAERMGVSVSDVIKMIIDKYYYEESD